ncbi:MAG: hypothetical protein WDN50_19300 [Bradyrhizobium sp.]
MLECQIRAIQLQQKTLRDDRFIFDLQGAADGGEIGVLGVVMLVADRGHDDAGRGRGEECLREPALA